MSSYVCPERSSEGLALGAADGRHKVSFSDEGAVHGERTIVQQEGGLLRAAKGERGCCVRAGRLQRGGKSGRLCLHVEGQARRGEEAVDRAVLAAEVCLASMRKCEVRVALAAAIAGNARLTSPVVAASTPKGVADVAAVTIRHVIKLSLALSGSANRQRKGQGSILLQGRSILLEGLGQFTLEPRILTCKLRAIRRGRGGQVEAAAAAEEEEAAEDEPEEEEEAAVAEADECEDKSEAAKSCSI